MRPARLMTLLYALISFIRTRPDFYFIFFPRSLSSSYCFFLCLYYYNLGYRSLNFSISSYTLEILTFKLTASGSLESSGRDLIFFYVTSLIVLRMRSLDGSIFKSLGILAIFNEVTYKMQLMEKVRTTISPSSLKLTTGVGFGNLSLGFM